MEVDEQAAEKESEKTVEQLTASVLLQITDSQAWYGDEEESVRLAREVLHLVSVSPGQIFTVTGKLVQALVLGAKGLEASYLVVAGRSWTSRSELNTECRNIMKRYPQDGTDLEDVDAALIKQLLQYHPNSAHKLAKIQGLTVARHPTFDKRVFYVRRKKDKEDFSYARCVDNVSTHEVRCQRRICDVIHAIMRLHPTSCESVCQIIESKQPRLNDKKFTVEKHRNWTQCLLHICTEFSSLTEWTLAHLIRKMLEVDVHILKIEEGTDEAEDERQLSFLAQVLDAQMLLLFEFFQRQCTHGANVPEANTLAQVLLGIFQSTVIPTSRSRYVQYLFFYLASLHVRWTENFLNILMQVVYSQQLPLQKRLVALSYLASFVSRATFLTPLFGIKVVQYLVTFIHQVQDDAEKSAASGRTEHPALSLFIAGVQAVCYILCFRLPDFKVEAEAQRELSSLLPPWGSPRGSVDTFTLVLESQMEPVAYIQRNVANQFCKSIRPHFPGIAAQAENCIERLPRNEDASQYESYMEFPFDPYRLAASHIFLIGIYRTWTEEPIPPTASQPLSQGFGAEEDITETAKRSRLASMESQDESSGSDFDHVDVTEPTERGFIPSVGPSPAFRPQGGMEVSMSPLLMPMEATGEDDSFLLPAASIDKPMAGYNQVMSSYLSSKAYRAI